MATIASKEFTVPAYSSSYGLYHYKILVGLNSQDAGTRKSNLTVKVYQNKGTTPNGYAGNAYIRLDLHGYTSADPEDRELVAPLKKTNNQSSTWEEITGLRYTADYTHKDDGTLDVYYIVHVDNTGSVHQAAPRDATLEIGPVEVASLTPQPGITYTKLDQPADWLLTTADSDNDGTPMSFTFTPANGVHHHKLTVTAGDISLKNETAYNSGDEFAVGNATILEVIDAMAEAGVMHITATAKLESFNSSNVSLGYDTRTFELLACGIDRKMSDGTWRNGLLWRRWEVNGVTKWVTGIVWVKDGNTWKKGIGL